jgi:hypothetical protein
MGCDLSLATRFSISITSKAASNDKFVPGNEVLINAATGFISVVPSHNYTATATITVEVGAQRVDIAQWTFTAHQPDVVKSSVAQFPRALHPEYGPDGVDCARGMRADGARYDHAYTCDCTGTDHTGSHCEIALELPQLQVPNWGQRIPTDASADDYVLASDARRQWVVHSTYRVAPINVTTGITVTSGATVSRRDIVQHNITFDLLWHNSTAPRGFFIDGATGEILIQVPAADGLVRHVSVRAGAPGTRPLSLYTLTFEFTPADTTNSTNGPNNEDCAGGSDQRIDIVEFDQRYHHLLASPRLCWALCIVSIPQSWV